MVTCLGKILASHAITSLGRKIATGNASFESHVMSISQTEARQLDELFRPPAPPQGQRSKYAIVSQMNAPNGQNAGMAGSQEIVPFEILNETHFAGARGIR